MTRQILQFLLALLVLVLGVACAAEPTPVPTPVPPTATPLPTNTPTFTPSPLPTATSTSTPAPTETTPPTVTGTPTVVASPTKVEQASPAAAAAGEGDVARGKVLFATNKCDSCHDISNPFPGGEYGPNLGNISTEALNVIALPDYQGTATNAAEYIRESVLMPNIYIVPGPNYIDAPGVSAMTQDFGESIPPQDLNDLIAYLLTLDAK